MIVPITDIILTQCWLMQSRLHHMAGNNRPTYGVGQNPSIGGAYLRITETEGIDPEPKNANTGAEFTAAN